MRPAAAGRGNVDAEDAAGELISVTDRWRERSPILPLEAWADTFRTLYPLRMQIVGKIRPYREPVGESLLECDPLPDGDRVDDIR